MSEDGRDRDDSDLPNRPNDIEQTPEPFSDQKDARPQHLDQLFEALQEAKRKGRTSDTPSTFDASSPPAPFYTRGSFALSLIGVLLLGSVWALTGLFSAIDLKDDSKKEEKVSKTEKTAEKKATPARPKRRSKSTPSRSTTARPIDRRSTTPPIQMPKRFTAPPRTERSQADIDREEAERERQREDERRRQEEIERQREEREYNEAPPLDSFSPKKNDDQIQDPELEDERPYDDPPLDEYGDELPPEGGFEGESFEGERLDEPYEDEY